MPVTLHQLHKILAQSTKYPWKKHPYRTPVMQPPAESSQIPLEVASMCLECELVYDERVGRCPKCAEASDRALKLITVLNRAPKEEN